MHVRRAAASRAARLRARPRGRGRSGSTGRRRGPASAARRACARPRRRARATAGRRPTDRSGAAPRPARAGSQHRSAAAAPRRAGRARCARARGGGLRDPPARLSSSPSERREPDLSRSCWRRARRPAEPLTAPSSSSSVAQVRRRAPARRPGHRRRWMTVITAAARGEAGRAAVAVAPAHRPVGDEQLERRVAQRRGQRVAHRRRLDAVAELALSAPSAPRRQQPASQQPDQERGRDPGMHRPRAGRAPPSPISERDPAGGEERREDHDERHDAASPPRGVQVSGGSRAASARHQRGTAPRTAATASASRSGWTTWNITAGSEASDHERVRAGSGAARRPRACARDTPRRAAPNRGTAATSTR